jgi:hypothetical protein
MTHWRVGRVVDGTGLENRHTRKGIGGSNPSLSAITKLPYSTTIPASMQSVCNKPDLSY